jgi:hypothetical protein
MRMIDEERKGRTTLHDDEVNKALDVVEQAICQHRDGKHKDYKPPEEGEINRRALELAREADEEREKSA